MKGILLVLVISSAFTMAKKHPLTSEGSKAGRGGASLVWVCLFYMNAAGDLSAGSHACLASSSPTGPPLQI